MPEPGCINPDALSQTEIRLTKLCDAYRALRGLHEAAEKATDTVKGPKRAAAVLEERRYEDLVYTAWHELWTFFDAAIMRGNSITIGVPQGEGRGVRRRGRGKRAAVAEQRLQDAAE